MAVIFVLPCKKEHLNKEKHSVYVVIPSSHQVMGPWFYSALKFSINAQSIIFYTFMKFETFFRWIQWLYHFFSTHFFWLLTSGKYAARGDKVICVNRVIYYFGMSYQLLEYNSWSVNMVSGVGSEGRWERQGGKAVALVVKGS